MTQLGLGRHPGFGGDAKEFRKREAEAMALSARGVPGESMRSRSMQDMSARDSSMASLMTSPRSGRKGGPGAGVGGHKLHRAADPSAGPAFATREHGKAVGCPAKPNLRGSLLVLYRLFQLLLQNKGGCYSGFFRPSLHPQIAASLLFLSIFQAKPTPKSECH